MGIIPHICENRAVKNGKIKVNLEIISYPALTFQKNGSKILYYKLEIPILIEKGQMPGEVDRLDLTEELEYKIAFSIGSLQVPQYVVTTWGIMALLVIVSILMTRNLKLVPGRRQVIVEGVVSFLYTLYYDIVGEKGKRYIPYLGSVCIFLAIADGVGLLGISPPTRNLNVTVALAILSILLVQVAAIQTKGTKGWLKGFAEPVAVVAPMNVLDLFTRPLSLSLRLFGNVLGGVIIMALLDSAIPIGVPLIGSAYFDIFDGLLQAYVFTFLTSLYLQEAIE